MDHADLGQAGANGETGVFLEPAAQFPAVDAEVRSQILDGQLLHIVLLQIRGDIGCDIRRMEKWLHDRGIEGEKICCQQMTDVLTGIF